jgi:CelD/BcsL family acetyltransferase involved in cellulose biosynthesis
VTLRIDKSQHTMSVRCRLLSGFDDPVCSPANWDCLLRRGETDTIALTRGWAQAWWQTLGEGALLLTAAERAGETIALAPFYSVGGMVYFLGTGESDYLDFIGDTSDPQVLPGLLQEAQNAVTDFLGFHLYLVPGASPTRQRLEQAARQIGLNCLLLNEWTAHEVDLIEQREAILRSTNRSMLKREDYFRHNGDFAVKHCRGRDEVRAYLPDFFAQHIARWQVKDDYRSPFESPAQQKFLERLVDVAAKAGWLRFLRLEWRGRPLAMAFAWYYRGTHFSGPWCFDIAHGRHCPGHVLMRHSLLAALDEGLSVYDLRGGDDPFKSRLPLRIKTTLTWGLYPP